MKTSKIGLKIVFSIIVIAGIMLALVKVLIGNSYETSGTLNGTGYEYSSREGCGCSIDWRQLLLKEPDGKSFLIYNYKKDKAMTDPHDYYTITERDGSSITYTEGTITIKNRDCKPDDIMSRKDALQQAREKLMEWLPKIRQN